MGSWWWGSYTALQCLINCNQAYLACSQGNYDISCPEYAELWHYLCQGTNIGKVWKLLQRAKKFTKQWSSKLLCWPTLLAGIWDPQLVLTWNSLRNPQDEVPGYMTYPDWNRSFLRKSQSLLLIRTCGGLSILGNCWNTVRGSTTWGKKTRWRRCLTWLTASASTRCPAVPVPFWGTHYPNISFTAQQGPWPFSVVSE